MLVAWEPSVNRLKVQMSKLKYKIPKCKFQCSEVADKLLSNHQSLEAFHDYFMVHLKISNKGQH